MNVASGPKRLDKCWIAGEMGDETQLDLLKSVGIQNYGQLQADPANKVEGKAD